MEAFTISKLFKKVAAAMLVVPMFMMYATGMGVSADESSKTIEYNCLGSALGMIDVDIDMDVTISSTVPNSVEPGEEFSIENSYTNISMAVTDTLRTATNPLEGSVPQFQLNLDNTEENMVDVAEEASEELSFGPIPIEDEDETVEFRVPADGGVDVGITAGDSGDIEISAGEIITVVNALDMLDVEVTCTPLEGQDLVLNTIPIEEQEEDTEAPVITLNGENPMELEVGQEYDEPGATAEDNVDGDLTDEIEIDNSEVNTDEPGEYTVTYTVSDAAGNEAEKTRTVHVVDPDEDGEDTEAPVITLNGDNPMELEVGEVYEEPGATAEDNVDGDLTDEIEISGEVNTEEPGEYTVTYTVSDAAGNEATETRTVHVVEPDENGEEQVPVTPGEETEVNSGDTVIIEESGTVVTLPSDLPEGTTLTVTDASDTDAEGLALAGDIYNFSFTYPDGAEPAESFTLEMEYDSESYEADEVAIYYYNEEEGVWVAQEGTVDEQSGTITIEITHFSTYGVFAESEESEEPGEETGGTWFAGEGEPAAELGEEGDLYLDTATFNVYGKDEDGWELLGTLRGEDGVDGATWLTGEGAPEEVEGNYGDLYLDTVSGDVYLYSVEADGWEVVANLQGPPGEGVEEDVQEEEAENGNGAQEDNGTTDEDESENGTATSGSGGQLPDTATNNPLLMLIGSLLAVAGGAIAFVRKRVLS